MEKGAARRHAGFRINAVTLTGSPSRLQSSRRFRASFSRECVSDLVRGSVHRSEVRRLFLRLVVLSVALPLAALVTFLLAPFWNWFEGAFGIESLGHSGPATWCFAAVYAIVLIVSLGAWRIVCVLRRGNTAAHRETLSPAMSANHRRK